MGADASRSWGTVSLAFSGDFAVSGGFTAQSVVPAGPASSLGIASPRRGGGRRASSTERERGRRAGRPSARRLVALSGLLTRNVA